MNSSDSRNGSIAASGTSNAAIARSDSAGSRARAVATSIARTVIPARSTVGREVGDVAFVVALHRDEIAACVLDRLRGHSLEDLALGAALHCRLAVAGDVARAAVEQAMIAPRGAGIDVVLLDQYAVDAAQGKVTGQRRAGDTAADDQNLSLDAGWGIQCCLFRMLG